MYLLVFTVTYTTYVLILMLVCVVSLLFFSSRTENKGWKSDGTVPDGPKPWPIIGSLHLMIGYKVPFEAFRNLAAKYGQVFQIRLGSCECVVVNGLENIREVLMTKGDHFDGRPNFERYNRIFDGDKRNSLAFCDWSNLQRIRRDLLKVHTFPKSSSAKFDQLNSYITSETNLMLHRVAALNGDEVNFKPLLLHACANIFLMHFCSRRYEYDDQSFHKMTYYFDRIFWEVNQGNVADFIPWLLPLWNGHFKDIRKWTQHIRKFTHEIVSERYDTWSPDRDSVDYIDTFVETLRKRDQDELDLEIALFSLEDIIGGHSAIANFLMKVLATIVARPDVQSCIKKEILEVTKGKRDVTLNDRRSMPYTEAVILETIRVISSPIVPHVASQESSIAGLRIKKGTLIFLNNYDLNRDQHLWDNPEEFMPERFIINGQIQKPDHFFPFSTGRRMCMGYKIVQLVSFSILALTMQRYSISPINGYSYQVPIGDLALPFDTFKFKFIPESRYV